MTSLSLKRFFPQDCTVFISNATAPNCPSSNSGILSRFSVYLEIADILKRPQGSSSFPFSHHAYHSLCRHTHLTTQQRRSFILLTSIQVRDMAAATCITISKDKKPRASASLYNSAKAAHHITNELAAFCLIVILHIFLCS